MIVDDDGNNLKRMRQVDDSRVGRKPFEKLDVYIESDIYFSSLFLFFL